MMLVFFLVEGHELMMHLLIWRIS